MTPVVKEVGRTVLRMERKQLSVVDNKAMHEAGGDNKGIVINKQVNSGEITFTFLINGDAVLSVYCAFFP